MLYGHVETAADRVEHMTMLRELQDETGGFLTFIPLAYHPDHNELGEELGRVGTATTGYEDLRSIAIGRLYLDSIPHVKTHWPMVTPFCRRSRSRSGVTTSRARWSTSGSTTKPVRGPTCTCRMARWSS